MPHSNNDDMSTLYQLVADSMSDLVCIHEPSGAYAWVSPSVKRMLGYTPDELIGRSPYELFHPEDREFIRTHKHEPALQGEGDIHARYRMLHADGHYIWMETLTQPIVNDAGDVIKLHTASRDVTRQKMLETALAERESLYRSVIQSMAEGVLVFAADATILTFNDQALNILNLEPKDLANRDPRNKNWRAIRPDGSDIPLHEQPVMMTLATGKAYRNVTLGLLYQDRREPLWLKVSSEPVAVDAQDGPASRAAAVVTLCDISQQLRQEALLKQWSTVFKHSQEPIAIVCHQGNIKSANDAFNRLIFRDMEQSWEQVDWQSLLRDSGNDATRGLDLFQAVQDSGTWRGELWIRDIEGGVHVTWASISAIPADSGNWQHFIVIFSRYEEKHKQDEALRIQATHDPLTMLPNRMLLMDRFDMALKSAHRYNEIVGCLYIDLDNFKPINDRFGHAFGDEVLKIVARRLQTVIREDDTLARLGGDEFVIVATALHSEGAVQAIADKVLSTLQEPMSIQAQRAEVHASIGVSFYPFNGNTAEELLEAADQAMYSAKRLGGHQWRKSVLGIADRDGNLLLDAPI